MALVVKDRVKETTTTTGTGTLSLAGATAQFQTFVAGVGTTNTTYYAIEDANGTAWEVGLGTVTDASPDTLSRTTILASSTGSAISLSTGTHTVFATYPAGKAIFLDADGLTSFNLNDLPDVSFGGTNLSHTLLINNTPGSAPTHGTLGSDNNYNVGIGYLSLQMITDAVQNVSIGYAGNRYCTTGDKNVAIGSSALEQNTTGLANVAIGYLSQIYANDGDYNVGIGYETLRGNSDGTSTTGDQGNVGIGFQAGYSITTGDYNVIAGYMAAKSITTGSDNIAIGRSAVQTITDGVGNIGIGTSAFGSGSQSGNNYNVAIGSSAGYALTTGDKNIMLGYTAGYAHTSGDSMLFIANGSEAGNGTLIKGDMANKFLAIGMADVTLATEDAALQVYPKATNDSAYFAKMPSSHTGDLIRIENSSGTSLLTIDKDGLKLDNLVDISFGGSNLTNTILIGTGGPGVAPTTGSLSSDAAGNVGIGYGVLDALAPSDAPKGSYNVGVGYNALTDLTEGYNNVAVGSHAGADITTGISCVAIGSSALRENSTGHDNVAIGNSSTYEGTGTRNTAVGSHTLNGLTTGTNNVAVGYASQQYSQDGDYNISVGINSMQGVYGTGDRSDGTLDDNYNTAVGYKSLYGIISGDNNIAIGKNAGYALTTASDMLFIANDTEAANGTLIKGDMTNKFLAVGKADVTLSTADATLQIFPSNTNDTVLYAKHTGTHTGDLILMENSSGTDLFRVDKDGNITAGTITVTASPVIPYTTITGDTTITTANVVVFVNAASGGVDVTLYAATGNGGRTVVIKKTDSSTNTVDAIAYGSETVDGNAQVRLSNPNESVTLISNNVNWFIV